MKVTQNITPAEQAERDNKAAGTNLVAKTNISAGEYFTLGEKNYQATSAIVRGEVVKPGYNCTEINITEILNKLNSEEV